MIKHFTSFEAVIADEDFFAWHTRTDAAKAQAWQTWLASHADYQPVVHDAIQYLESIRLKEAAVPQHQTEAAQNRLLHSIHSIEATVVPLKRKIAIRWMMAAAAVVAVIAGVAFFKQGSDKVILAAPYGQLAQYNLPDGSSVTLNAASKLTLSDGWDKGATREVWLEGEGFFEVKKTATKAGFVVHADGMDVLVTGTKFNVVNREGDRNVLLTEGSITLKTEGGKELKMTPGEFITLDKTEPQKKVAPETKVLAWRQAKLVFENTSMNEVAAIISRHYGIKVQLEKGLGEKTITGIMPNNNLEALLQALEATADFSITRSATQIVIANASPTL